MFFSRRKPKDPTPPPVGSHDRKFRSIFAGIPMIVGLVLVGMFVLLIILHGRFTQNVAACRLYYPNANVVAEDPGARTPSRQPCGRGRRRRRP